MQGTPSVSLGDVLYLKCTLCNPPKMKFFVVAQVQPLRMFLISSELTDFARANNAYLAACPAIRAADHPSFLTHDSHVSCDWVSHEYSLEQIEAKLSAEPTIRRGNLHPDACAAVAVALKGNRLLERKYLRELEPLWERFGR